MADRGRIAVYRCEDLYSRMCQRAHPPGGPVLTEIAGSKVLLPAERKFADIASIADYIRVLRRSCPEAVWPRSMPELEVRVRAGHAGAHWEAPGTIAIPDTPEMMREHVVLHEVAHHLDHHNGNGPAPAHGPSFRKVLCDLHGAATGKVGGWALAVLFDQHLPPPTN